jgi:enoyl-CoA hydratase/carnithine racemase
VAEIPDLPERIARLESGESLADADRDADRLDADRLVAAGQDFNAKQLPNRVVPDDELIDAATAMARRIADGPRLAYAASKLLLTREADMDLASAIGFEAMAQAMLMTTDDHAEFHSAFNRGEARGGPANELRSSTGQGRPQREAI